MEPSFWLERWQRGETGFHLDETNPWLIRQWPALQLAAGQHVLVPLCGKSLDLRFLADQGLQVTGVELSPLAIEAFFREQQLDAKVRDVPGTALHCHEAVLPAGNRLRIFCGDFFALTPALLGPVDAAWDRAALIALPPDMRTHYAAQLGQLLAPGARLLMMALDYPQAERAGPPFSVPQAEIRALFGKQFDIAALGREDLLARAPRYREWGLSRLTETGWLLLRRPG